MIPAAFVIPAKFMILVAIDDSRRVHAAVRHSAAWPTRLVRERGSSVTERLRRLLERANPFIFTSVAGLAGFAAYFSMYAFRKPFSAASFAVVPGWTFALDYKIALVLAQVMGYAMSKMIGIKVISELNPARRASAIIALILLSGVALVLFAVIPAPWNVLAMFLNGLPLGMIWGLVFGFMEGRRTSEVLGAILCASFIVSSGAVKSVGTVLLHDWHVDRWWMPAATGALFLPLLFVSVFVLSALPPPNAFDEAARACGAHPWAAGSASASCASTAAAWRCWSLPTC